MKEFFIGEVLKKRRIELGLTQEQVCEGIFSEPSAISRIENGRQTPNYRKLTALLQRLGLPGDRYYALVDKNELEISKLQTQIRFCNIRQNSKEGLLKISELENIASTDDLLAQQFILRSKVALGKYENGHIIPYSFSERCNMLFSALHLTCSDFNINNFEDGLYSVEELKIINQIALTYSNAGQRKISLGIYSQLLRYIQNHLSELYQSMIIILVAYNYSRDLCFEKRLEEATKVGKLGLKISIETSYFAYLGGLYFTLAYCFGESGQDSESKKYFRFSYCAYSSIEDSKNAMLAQRALKERFNIDITF